jgi:hypothetical protein
MMNLLCHGGDTGLGYIFIFAFAAIFLLAG